MELPGIVGASSGLAYRSERKVSITAPVLKLLTNTIIEGLTQQIEVGILKGELSVAAF